MFNTNQSTFVLVNSAVSSSVADNVALDDISVLEDGEIAIVNDQFKTQTTLVKGDRFKFVMRDGATAATASLIQTPWLIYNDNLRMYSKAVSAAAEQISYVGYNGTSGSITATSLNDYVLGITFKHDKDMWSEQANKRIFYYTSDASATQAEIADGLNLAMVSDTFLTDDVLVERVCNVAGTEALGASDTIVGSRGSKTLTVVETGGVLPYLFAVGDYIRIGTAVTSPIYKIAETTVTVADGGTITLDAPLQASVSLSGTGVGEYITAAEAATANFGLKLTGRALDFIVGKLKYTKVMFDTTLKNFGSTSVTVSQRAALGSGTYEQIAELEWFANGFRVAPDRFGDSAPTFTPNAVSTLTYDIISVHSDVANSPNHAISGQKNAQCQVILAFDQADTTNGNDLAAALYTNSAVPGLTTASPF